MGPPSGGRWVYIVETVVDDVPDGISAEDHQAGLTSSLANLADHVVQGRVQTNTGHRC